MADEAETEGMGIDAINKQRVKATTVTYSTPLLLVITNENRPGIITLEARFSNLGNVCGDLMY
jgi:hypothetical protein